jgi:hypothetical protein
MEEGEDSPMTRTLMVLTMVAALASPLMARADETAIPPEAQWTSTPSAGQTVDPVRLTQLLRERGIITDQEYLRLTHPELAATGTHGNSRVRSWADIDAYERSPINSGAQGD